VIVIYVLVGVSIAMVKHHGQKQLEEERVISAHSLKSIIEGTQGRNLDARTDVETMEESHLLVCSPWLTQLGLLIGPRNTCQG
jgi:hypothetical protein